MFYFGLEAFHTSHTIDKFHFSCEERVAIGANFNLDFILCRTHGKRVATGTGDDCIRVPLGVNIGFHARIIAFSGVSVDVTV